MTDAIRDLFARVVEDAVWNYLTCGFLAATGTLTQVPDTDSVRKQLLQDPTNWTLISNRTQRYTDQEFCLVSNFGIFREAFLSAYRIKERFNTEAFVKGLVQTWTLSPVYECFVLSKILGNMHWHVDGGSKVASDLVVYNLLGPSDSVSCFMLLVVDTMRLLKEQVADTSFPTCEEINTDLSKLDELNIPMEMPDLTGCEGTFCGLVRKPELNGMKVNVIYVDDDEMYIVEHKSGDRRGEMMRVHPRNLNFAPGYCVLPDEIAFVVPHLSIAVQRAVAAHVVCCRFIWGREGDVVVFDGSMAHAVFNIESATGLPQLALAVNYRGVIPHVDKQMQCKNVVRLKMRVSNSKTPDEKQLDQTWLEELDLNELLKGFKA